MIATMEDDLSVAINGSLVCLETRGIESALTKVINVLKCHKKIVGKIPEIVDSNVAIKQELNSIRSKTASLIDEIHLIRNLVDIGPVCRNEEEKNSGTVNLQECSEKHLNEIDRELLRIKSFLDQVKQSQENTTNVNHVTHRHIDLLKAEVLH